MLGPMGQLLLRIAELFERCLIAVPDVDLSIPLTSRHCAAGQADCR